MKKTVNVKLTPHDVDFVQSQLESLSEEMEIATKDIVSELVEKGKDYAQSAYNQFEYRSGTTECDINSDVDELSGYISLVGEEAFYEEFGTGELGARNPHPTKNRFEVPLNDYNSGPFVSSHIKKSTRVGWHYWFYGPKAGSKGYYGDNGLTYGIPSGKMMYNTGKYLHKQLKNIAEDKIKEMTAKFR